MMDNNIRALSSAEIEQVTGADQGVVAGPNGEGCTDPVPTKPGRELIAVDPSPFG